MNLTFTNHQQARRCFSITALILLGLAYAIMLFYRGFFDPDEGRYSEVPREMVTSGHWDELRMLGYRYYEKPPLAYWMVAPAIALFGAHDWAVRLPLLINIILILALFRVLIHKHWPNGSGTMALLVLMSMIGFLVGFCLLLTDGFLVFWFSLTCACLFWAFQRESSVVRNLAFLLLASLSAVLGFLTKGAIAIALPAAILFFWLLWERRLRALLTPSLLLAGLFVIALLMPCLQWLERHNPGFLRHFIFEEHLARFMGTRLSQLHPEPFWFYIAIIPLLLLPWTLFIVRAIRTIIIQRLFVTDSMTKFLTVWIAVIVLFFSFSTGKLMSYILPAIPPLGLLLGRWGVAEPPNGTRRDQQFWNLGMAGPWLTTLAILLVWLISYFQLAPQLTYPISGISALALIPLIVTLGILLWARGLRHFHGALLFNSVLLLTAALLLSPLAGKDFNVLLHINSSCVYKKLARMLKPEDRLVVFWEYRPALPFYTQRLTYAFQVKNELEYGMLMEPDRRRYLRHQDELNALFQTSTGRIYAIVTPEDYESKFLPLKLNFTPGDFPQDPDTMILELLPPKAESPTQPAP